MTRKHGRKSWRKSWRLFNQAIYIYLISCWIKSSFWVELSSQASQLDSSAWVQLLNLIQHFFKNLSIQLNTFQVEYLTWTWVLDSMQSVYLKVSDYAFRLRFSLVLKASISFETFFISSLNIHWLYSMRYSFHCIL